MRHVKVNSQKKLLENLSTCQKELQFQVQDLDRTKRLYTDEENVAHDAREKAIAAEEKLKRKKGSIFQSITSMQKNSAKFTAKREMCDEKSSGARNDYLLSLESTNAHQRRYYEKDFEKTLRTLEHRMFEKVADYFSLISRTELAASSATQNSFNTIRDQAKTITRGYNLRCYLTFYPMLGKSIEYEFIACKGDKTSKIGYADDNTLELLNSESHRMVEKLVKEIKTIHEAKKKMKKLQQSQKPDGELPPEAESKIDEIRQIIRKCETTKVKTIAKLDALKDGGVFVEDYAQMVDVNTADSDEETPFSHPVKEETQKPPQIQAKKSIEQEPTVQPEEPKWEAKFSTESVDIDTEKSITTAQRSLDQGSWDPLSVDWGDEAEPQAPQPQEESWAVNGVQEEESIAYPKCIALYNYEAQNPDELTIFENEQLEIINEGDGDGWVQAKNEKELTGYIPQNYIEMLETDQTITQATQLTSQYSEDVTHTDYVVTNGTDTQYQYSTQKINAVVDYMKVIYSLQVLIDAA